jgi:hypothetical protein
MFLIPSLIATSVRQDDGLTLGDFIAAFPLDPASLLALFLGLGFVAGVLYFGTRGATSGGDDAAVANQDDRRPTDIDSKLPPRRVKRS